MKSWHCIVGILLITTCTLLIEIPVDTWLTSASLSLVLGATALVYMAVSCLLASRWRVVEHLFGGLDRVYDAHKWLGIWALVFATYHFVFKANLDVWNSVPILELPKYWARLVRQLSYASLGLIVLLALNRNIPYRLWRWWHKLSGPLFLIVIVHWLSFKSPITLASPSGIWLTVFCGLGVVAAFYKLLLYPFVARAGEYQVTAVSSDKSALHLTLIPMHKGFPFKAGQFAFLAMKEKGLREPHPFTIASAHGANGQIEFVIRALGDYTQKLREQVKVGMLADIYAPYGRFRRQPQAEREIWIGAGVGISPFVSWLQDRKAHDFDKATLVYCFNPSRAFPPVERLQAMAEVRGVKFVGNAGGVDQLAETLRQAVVQAEPHKVHVSFCGPKGLLAQVRELMRASRIPEANLHIELFEFR
ncbi:Dihydroorotate dehydrogenase B (NAD(+)), electron transfer subunit [Pseudomonas fluorescens]|uniref:Dihydroorotate dehydrogenase B (NAD(+)), electron transfer subunit n=1 Tax=Pseudomonas fluorescens TaxID=294 RepID=A0A5E7W2X6_PSEFL|nr:ferredoxin reductase family protein [Pseudomonas fluorescens]VVQ29214.1 Dihydroorotate dehydrogenase B (NAD(+)), electron transfer subunit [Pseudomonas fluorescens]